MTTHNGDLETQISDIEQWYSDLEQGIAVSEQLLPHLVSAVDNRERGIHRWYSLKESYSAELPPWIVRHIINSGEPIKRVLDPFVGAGTTGVALAQQGIAVDGVEYNPFIYFVAYTKSRYAKYEISTIREALERLRLNAPMPSLPIPPLSTLSNERYFRAEDVQIFLSVIAQIQASDWNTDTANFLRLGVAASIEGVANLRKDGRALRYEVKPDRCTASEILSATWERMLADLDKTEYKAQFNVYPGTAMKLPDSITGLYDMILYSPPYLNNFDYSEVYKLELWLLGFVESLEEWRSLRRNTIRSHPSIRFEREDVMSNVPGLAEFKAKISNWAGSTSLLGERNEVGKILLGYFEDMYLALKEQWRVLRPGGHLAIVVANSRHGNMPIATDVLLCEVARKVGFVPKEIIVFKKRNGRTRHKAFLRESVAILEKPLS